MRLLKNFIYLIQPRSSDPTPFVALRFCLFCVFMVNGMPSSELPNITVSVHLMTFSQALRPCLKMKTTDCQSTNPPYGLYPIIPDGSVIL